MALVTDEIRGKAEVYYGNEICKQKSMELLKEMGLPNGLLPLEDILECGYAKETGFVWLKQKKKKEHKFVKIGKLVSYATEVTAYVEPNRIKKLSGVKSKEILIWVNLSEISVDCPPTGKITFKTPAGLSRALPVSAFEIEEPKLPNGADSVKVQSKEAADVPPKEAADVKSKEAADVQPKEAADAQPSVAAVSLKESKTVDVEEHPKEEAAKEPNGSTDAAAVGKEV